MRLLLALGVLFPAGPASLPAQNFGSAVATTGGDVLVGEPLNQYAPGLVHVYRRTAGGWQRVAQLSAPDGHALDRFGRSLSADGHRLLVGTTSIRQARGAAFVYERDRAGIWHLAAQLTVPDAEPGEAYGRQVLLRGDEAYVAAWGRHQSRGAVHLWRRSGSDWTAAGAISAGDARPGDFFGTSLALEGDLLAVGASQRDSARGAVYLFRRAAGGGWTEEARLVPDGLARNAGFGSAVALRDAELLVGSPGAETGSGLVFVYGRDAGGVWTERARLRFPDPTRFAQFGGALLTLAGEVWAAAPFADQGAGAVFRMLQGPGGDWSVGERLTHPAHAAGDFFGYAMAAAGETAVIGFPGDDHGAGTAAVFGRPAGRWTGDPKLVSDEKTLAALTGGTRDCTDGAIDRFACRDMELLAFLPVNAIGGGRGVRLNDVWGWTDGQTGREFALVGRIDGTSFVDVTDPTRPVYLGDLPKTEASPAAMWRDIKVYRDHAYIVADGSAAHGMQVFDLTRLRAVSGAPVRFTPDLTYDRIHSAHNIVIDTLSGYAYAVGANGGGDTCGGALHMIDIREPKAPRFAGCFADPTTGNQRTGYTHDAQCVVYAGPDSAYQGRQICFNASENAVGIADVTDKANPRALARASYPNVGYTHQGWLTEDQRYFYVNDEGDELSGTVAGTRTLIWDVSDLDDPVLAGEYIADNRASDHNLYVRGQLMFQSNYASGLRVLDISDPRNPRPVAFLDTHPVGEDAPGFQGSWSNYPFFRSGTLVVTSIQEGLFLMRPAARPLVP